MTKRCILCEQKKTGNFYLGEKFCDNCWRNNTNSYLADFETNFNIDLFYLKYPEEKPTGSRVDIDSNLNRLESELRQSKGLLTLYERDNSKEEAREARVEIARLESEIAQLKQFQQTAQIQQGGRK